MPQRLSAIMRSNPLAVPGRRWIRAWAGAGAGAWLIGARVAADLGEVSGAVAISWCRAPVQRMVLAGDVLLSWASVRPGARLLLAIVQDATGGRAVTWPDGVLWSGGQAPALSTDPGAVDLIEFICTNGVAVYGRLWGLSFQSST
jgi:hypothetical protein